MCRKVILAIVIKNYVKAGIKSKYQLFSLSFFSDHIPYYEVNRYINQRSSVPHVN